jgi:hypothetical protein
MKESSRVLRVNHENILSTEEDALLESILGKLKVINDLFPFPPYNQDLKDTNILTPRHVLKSALTEFIIKLRDGLAYFLIFVLGTSGVGKTRIAKDIIEALKELGIDIYIQNWDMAEKAVVPEAVGRFFTKEELIKVVNWTEANISNALNCQHSLAIVADLPGGTRDSTRPWATGIPGRVANTQGTFSNIDKSKVVAFHLGLIPGPSQQLLHLYRDAINSTDDFKTAEKIATLFNQEINLIGWKKMKMYRGAPPYITHVTTSIAHRDNPSRKNIHPELINPILLEQIKTVAALLGAREETIFEILVADLALGYYLGEMLYINREIEGYSHYATVGTNIARLPVPEDPLLRKYQQQFLSLWMANKQTEAIKMLKEIILPIRIHRAS